MLKTLSKICALGFFGLTIPQCATPQDGGILFGPGMDMASGDPDQGSAGDLRTPTFATPTEFVVVRIGTGTGALTNDATAAFLERRVIQDGALNGTTALPTAASGQNKQLTLSGLATVEGQLSRSVDGRYLVIAGYAANPGVANISTSSATTYNRVIGRIDATNNINTATATSAYSSAGVRGAASMDGNLLWISTENGIGHTTLDSVATPTVLSTVVTRAIDIFPGGSGPQLLVTSSSTTGPSYQGVNSVGTGTPTAAAQSVTRLSGFTNANSPAAVGFVGFDRDHNGAIDQLYVADDRTSGGGGVQRYQLNGTTWTLDGTISTGSGAGARYLAGYVAGANATLLVTTAEGFGAGARVLLLTDSGGATTAVTTRLLATAATNTTYRGIALAPSNPIN